MPLPNNLTPKEAADKSKNLPHGRYPHPSPGQMMEPDYYIQKDRSEEEPFHYDSLDYKYEE